jgi:hypothetical protein
MVNPLEGRTRAGANGRYSFRVENDQMALPARNAAANAIAVLDFHEAGSAHHPKRRKPIVSDGTLGAESKS